MADMNFNFDLSAFNKGIDEIQKRIQQLGNALKVATDPKSVKALTSALQEANNELDSLKSNLAGLGSSLSQTLPNIGNSIASSMNLATTSMDAMVSSSAQLVAQLKAAQGMATIPFVQQQVQQQTTKTGPSGGAMFGAGGDVSNYRELRKIFDDLSSNANKFGTDWDKVTKKFDDEIRASFASLQEMNSEMENFSKTVSKQVEVSQNLDFQLHILQGDIADLNQAYSDGDIDLDTYTKSLDSLEKKERELSEQHKESQKSVNDLKSQYGNLEAEMKKSKDAFDQLVDSKKNIPKEEQEYLKTVSGEYAKLSDKYYKARLAALDYNTAINELQTKQSRGIQLTDDEIASLEKYRSELLKVETSLSDLEDRKNKVEASMGGSRSKNRFGNELFSVQQILREMPAFTYNVQTGFLALSNNIPILLDDFAKIKNSIDSTTGATIGFKGALKQMVGQIFTFTGIATIVTSILTIWGPQLWNLITGTNELTEAQKKLNEETAQMTKKYSEAKAEIDAFINSIDNGTVQFSEHFSYLVALENKVGLDLTSAYSRFGNTIKDVTDLQKLLNAEIEKQFDYELNLKNYKSAYEGVESGQKKLGTALVKLNADQTKAYNQLKAAKLSSSELQQILTRQGSLGREDAPQLTGRAAQYSGIAFQIPTDVIKKMATLKLQEENLAKAREKNNKLLKEGNLSIKQRIELTEENRKMNILNAEAASMDATGSGTLTTEKQAQIRKDALKKQMKELGVIAKDIEKQLKKQNSDLDKEIAKTNNEDEKKKLRDKKISINEEGKWILTKQKEVQAELNRIDGKGRDKSNKDREKTVRTFVEKEVNIEKQLIEDRRNLEKLRLEIIKDSYDKQALIIEEKYDEMAEKARQRNEDELKILKDNFENRIEFQRQEADIREKASKMSKGQADIYVKQQMEILKDLKAAKWKDMLEGRMLSNENDRYVYSQVVRSNEIMAQTIKRQQENLYKELTDMARGYALARFNEDRTLLKKNLLENIISNEETLKIQLNQYKVFLEKMNKFDEERTFRFYKSPLVANIKVGKNEVETFMFEKLPEYENELNNLIKKDPSSERIGVLQNAISKLKGEVVDFNDIFKDSINGYEKLKEVRDADIKDVEDSKMTDKEKADAIALINSRYDKMIVYLDKYNQLLKASKGDVKDMYSPEDAQKVNELQDQIVMLTEKKRELQKEMDESTGTENVDINRKIIETTNKISLLNQAIVKFNESIKEANAAKLAFGKLIPEMQKDMPEFSLKAVPAINTKAVFADRKDINNVSNLKTVLDNAASFLKEGNLEESNKKLREAAGIVAALKGKLTDEEKALLAGAFKTQWEEGSKILEEQFDKKRGEMVAKTVRKGNLTEVPKEFSRREMWAQNKLNLDLEGAEIEHQRKMLELKKDTIGVTEKELEEFHKKEMEFIQKRKTFIADNIREIADSIGSVFQTTFDQISTFANNSMQLENERMALMQAQSDNLVASYDRQIDKLKEIMDTQIMSADERINAEQRVLDLERLKAQEEKNQKIRALELQKKQIEINKKLALAQAAISGGVALANVVAIATEGAAGTGPAAPFVFAAQLAAGIGAVSGAIFSAKQAIESADLQTATIDEQIAGIESAYQAGLSKGAGVTSAFASGQGPSAPLTTFNKDLVNQGQASANYNVNDTLKGYKIYVTQADIQNANNQVTKITKKVTFG